MVSRACWNGGRREREERGDGDMGRASADCTSEGATFAGGGRGKAVAPGNGCTVG
jgi:hypothetical protein